MQTILESSAESLAPLCESTSYNTFGHRLVSPFTSSPTIYICLTTVLQWKKLSTSQFICFDWVYN